MHSLNRQIHFLASTKRSLLVGLILCIYLSFIIIVLQPFDTSQFDAEYKTLLLSGYGIITGMVFMVHNRLEKIRYVRSGKVWTVRHEIISILLFCVVLGTVNYCYNRTIVNNFKPYTLATYWWFLSVTVVCMLPVFIPPMVYLRQKLGERIVPPAANSIVLIGENKNEVLRMDRDDLLFIKAVENYVEICFTDQHRKVVSRTFRQTLSNVCEQLPFLEKCHRSYLVNRTAIKEVAGNSQGARIIFAVGDKEIPLSKTYYKQIKEGG